MGKAKVTIEELERILTAPDAEPEREVDLLDAGGIRTCPGCGEVCLTCASTESEQKGKGA